MSSNAAQPQKAAAYIALLAYGADVYMGAQCVHVCVLEGSYCPRATVSINTRGHASSRAAMARDCPVVVVVTPTYTYLYLDYSKSAHLAHRVPVGARRMWSRGVCI